MATMTSFQRQKAKIKALVKASNEAEAAGLPADPWVVTYRLKNNVSKAKWKAKQPKKEPKKVLFNSGWFKKGHQMTKSTPEEAVLSKQRKVEYYKVWASKNKEKINSRIRNKRATNPEFKIKCNLRKRLSSLLRLSLVVKTEQTMSLLGCDMDSFKKHLKDQFADGMTFENYGKWHLDHKIPCFNFDLNREEDRRKCFHFHNIQPLWAIDNWRKNKQSDPQTQ